MYPIFYVMPNRTTNVLFSFSVFKNAAGAAGLVRVQCQSFQVVISYFPMHAMDCHYSHLASILVFFSISDFICTTPPSIYMLG